MSSMKTIYLLQQENKTNSERLSLPVPHSNFNCIIINCHPPKKLPTKFSDNPHPDMEKVASMQALLADNF